MDDLLQATDDKHLILEDQFEGEANTARPPLHFERRLGFWDSRYFCIQSIHDDEFWRFDIFDFLTNDSKSVRFRKSANQFRRVETYFLDCKFMLIVEREDRFGGLNRVNLVKLNWESGVFEALEHFERRIDIVKIVVDSLNQSKFVLVASTFSGSVVKYQDCKLVNDKVEFGNVYRFSDRCHQCSCDKLIEITYLWQRLHVKTYSMVDKQEQSFETELCPEHVELLDGFLFKWVVDRLYAAIWFRDFGNYGLMWSDEKTRRWTILDFTTIMRIRKLHFFNGSLIVCTQQERIENDGVFKSNVKVYEIAVYRPQSLRQKAWLRVVRNLKLKGNPNPYKEAARYLPFNTDLRPHWFEDVEEGAPDYQGNDVGDEAVQTKFANLSV